MRGRKNRASEDNQNVKSGTVLPLLKVFPQKKNWAKSWTCGHLLGYFLYFPHSVLFKFLTSTMHHHQRKKPKRKQVKTGFYKTKLRYDLKETVCRLIPATLKTKPPRFIEVLSNYPTLKPWGTFFFLMANTYTRVKRKTIAVEFRGVTASTSAFGCNVSTYIWAKLHNVACRPHLSVWLITARE